VLTGPAGSGKTAVGRRLSAMTGRDFVDMAVEIVGAHGNVHEMSDDGRISIERDVVTEIAPKRNLVIATTPTTLLDEENVIAFLGAEVFHLSASTEELAARIAADGIEFRPELSGADDLSDAIEKLDGERAAQYEKFTTIDTTELSIDQVVDALRAAGAPIEDPQEAAATEAAAGGMDKTTRIYMYIITAGVVIMAVLLFLMLSFS